MERNLCGNDRHSNSCYRLIRDEKCPDVPCILQGDKVPIDLKNVLVDNTNINKSRDNDGEYD